LGANGFLLNPAGTITLTADPAWIPDIEKRPRLLVVAETDGPDVVVTVIPTIPSPY
jgi:hypothetical protein